MIPKHIMQQYQDNYFSKNQILSQEIVNRPLIDLDSRLASTPFINKVFGNISSFSSRAFGKIGDHYHLEGFKQIEAKLQEYPQISGGLISFLIAILIMMVKKTFDRDNLAQIRGDNVKGILFSSGWNSEIDGYDVTIQTTHRWGMILTGVPSLHDKIKKDWIKFEKNYMQHVFPEMGSSVSSLSRSYNYFEFEGTVGTYMYKKGPKKGEINTGVMNFSHLKFLGYDYVPNPKYFKNTPNYKNS